MQCRYVFLLAVCAGLTGCADSVREKPAPVLNFGLSQGGIVNPLLPPALRAEIQREPLSLAAVAPAPFSGFRWPVHGKIISPYGAKEGGLFNEGINIAAPRGTPVMAAAEGVVAYVGRDIKGYGNLILIRHDGGAMTTYAHMDSIFATKGAVVGKGQPIGTIGSTGTVAAAQLHFEIRHGSKTCDPLPYLG